MVVTLARLATRSFLVLASPLLLLGARVITEASHPAFYSGVVMLLLWRAMVAGVEMLAQRFLAGAPGRKVPPAT
ncbi:MAG: hypothetical protein WDA16_10305 [Candidatus Thermoplasmatota archaeon]